MYAMYCIEQNNYEDIAMNNINPNLVSNFLAANKPQNITPPNISDIPQVNIFDKDHGREITEWNGYRQGLQQACNRMTGEVQNLIMLLNRAIAAARNSNNLKAVDYLTTMHNGLKSDYDCKLNELNELNARFERECVQAYPNPAGDENAHITAIGISVDYENWVMSMLDIVTNIQQAYNNMLTTTK